jgi:predicted transcriptional regulator
MVEAADSVVFLPSEKVISTSSKLTASEREVLAALALEVFEESGAKSRQIFEAAQVKEGTAYGVLSKLKRLGYVHQSKKGDPYFITEQGRQQLSNYERTINSGADWSPDGNYEGEFGSPMGNYGTMTGFQSENSIGEPELPENYGCNYEGNTASQCPTMATINNYDATIEGDAHSLLWDGGYIYDTPHSEIGIEETEPFCDGHQAEAETPALIEEPDLPTQAHLVVVEQPDGWYVCKHEGDDLYHTNNVCYPTEAAARMVAQQIYTQAQHE